MAATDPRSARTGEELLVDGYNLLHCAPQPPARAAGGLQGARRALERALGAYARRTGAHVIVFYDGDAGAEPAGQQPAGLVRDGAGQSGSGRGGSGQGGTGRGDGSQGDGGREAAAASGWIQVRFSRAPEDADALIMQAVQRRHGARYVRVVSSDRRIRQFARRHRVTSTAAVDFLRELEVRPAATAAAAAAAAPPPRELDPDLALSPAEVDEWERLFRQAGGSDTSKPVAR